MLRLGQSNVADGAGRCYFNDLCKSIGASKIRDHNQLSIEVTADDSMAAVDVSVSHALIVTDHVINALRHAFPEHRSGKMDVAYDSDRSDWTRSGSDNGVGMPGATHSSSTGLGNTILDALGKDLNARAKNLGAEPGATVLIRHVG